MLCDICKKREAKIFLTEIINGQKREQHICERCVSENPLFQANSAIQGNDFSIQGLISGLLQRYPLGSKESKEEMVPVCARCGLSYQDFLEHSKFGCGHCYQSFAKLLGKNLRSIHGADIHTGKRPEGYVSETKRIVSELSEYDRLSIQLQQAIEQEEYEEAARLRDAIHAILAK